MAAGVQAWLLRHAQWLHGAMVLAWGLFTCGVLANWWRPAGRSVGLALFASVMAAAALLAWSGWRRERALREAPLPQFLKRKLREAYPQLSGKDAELVERGLRQFFLACLRSRKKFVAMPSRAVDAMWHEFILHTRAYRNWCDLALGRFLHHTPAEALGRRAASNDGLRRAWYWACKDEGINPRQPTRLPLLFALDAKLGIEGGFHYVPDCGALAPAHAAAHAQDGSAIHCAAGFSDGSASSDASGFGGFDAAGSGDAGADGAGCSSGCGGSCGGGD